MKFQKSYSQEEKKEAEHENNASEVANIPPDSIGANEQIWIPDTILGMILYIVWKLFKITILLGCIVLQIFCIPIVVYFHIKGEDQIVLIIALILAVIQNIVESDKKNQGK